MIRARSLAALFALAALAIGPLGCAPGTRDRGGTEPADRDPIAVPSGRVTHGKPKPVTATIERGLGWLVEHQLPGGGWGQGDEAPGMGNSMAKLRDTPNVADSSMALLALLRAGHSPRQGAHRAAVERGLAYVLSEVEASDDTSLRVTKTTGTRVQAKIGPYADTFAALLVLSEARGQMRDGIANARVDTAVKKIVRKIERNQRDDGTWDGQGWAPALSQALAAKGMNRAAQGGIQVSAVVLERLERQAHRQVDTTTYSFDAEAAAGVELYQGAATSAAARESATTKRLKAVDMKTRAKKGAGKELKSPDAPTAAEVKAAEASADASESAAGEVERALVTRLDSPGFRSGFGNNGGEEFLSYMLISETLAGKGGDEWAKWNQAIAALVDGVQNQDGSWTGHHCITGRTFCTAAALLVLMADRAPATLAR